MPAQSIKSFIFKLLRTAMVIMFVLILISLLVAIGFLSAYFWAARNGQFDDDCTPAMRMLFEDEIKQNDERAASEQPVSSNS